MNNWGHLPLEVQYHIFSFLDVNHLLTSVCRVCKEWNYVLNQVGFWVERLKQYEVDVTPPLHYVFQTHDNAGEALLCLKAACARLENPTSKFDSEMQQGDPWKLREDRFFETCIILLFRTPKLMFLEIFQNPSYVKYVQLLLKILSTKHCEVRLMDYYTWTDLDSETDDILLKSLTGNKCCMCDLTEFQGSLRDLSLLPKSMKKLCISIKGNLDISTKLQDSFPSLQVLELSISATSSNISSMQSLSEDISDVQIRLRFKSWKFPSEPYQDPAPTIILFSQRNMVTTFRGSICDIKGLPQTLTQLSISIANDEQAKMLPYLQNFVLLKELDIHIHCGDLSPSSLLPVTLLHEENQRIWLFLSDIGDNDIDWTVEVYKSLLPNLKQEDAQSLVLPSSTLTPDGYRCLVQKLAEVEGRREEADWEGAVYISSKHITKQKLMASESLHQYTLRVLDFFFTRFDNDMELSVYIGCDW